MHLMLCMGMGSAAAAGGVCLRGVSHHAHYVACLIGLWSGSCGALCPEPAAGHTGGECCWFGTEGEDQELPTIIQKTVLDIGIYTLKKQLVSRVACIYKCKVLVHTQYYMYKYTTRVALVSMLGSMLLWQLAAWTWCCVYRYVWPCFVH